MLFRSDDDVMAWVGGSVKWKAQLKYEGSIHGEDGILINTFVGHKFVAALKRDDGSLCGLEVWQAVQNIDDADDDEPQEFTLDDEISSRTVPGLNPCFTEESDEHENVVEEVPEPAEWQSEL